MSHYEQHNDNIREENEQPQLVQDLHSLYDTHAADTQSLARIRSRLLQRASIPLPDKEDSNIITFQSLDTPEKREGETIASTTTRRLNEWRNARRHWPRLVSEIAALVIITALLGSIVLVFSLRPHAPAHTGPLLSNSNGQIQQIHMVDAETGWAEVETKHGTSVDPASAIMRTTDGGHTWYDVTPPEPLNQWSTGVEVSEDVITNFLAANTAWIALVPVNAADSASLYFTNDGGRTWQESTLPAITFKDSILQMSFIDEQHGWLLTSSSAATQVTEEVTLFQTVDGGKTWLKVSESSASRSLSDTTPGPLPLEGVKTGFTFINAQTGWMVGEAQQANFFWFYVTHDGGRTWQHQNLPQPQPAILPGITDAGPQFELQRPTFFGNEGVLAFTIPTNGKYASSSSTANNETVEIYVSHDRGNTWQSTPSPLSTNSIPSGIFDDVQFVDATHGSVSIGNQIFFVHRNTNSDSWTVTSTTIHGELLQLSFVSPSTCWILVDGVLPNSYRVNPDAQWLLYQTTDGGKTWTQVNYNVMGQQVQTTQKLNKGWTPIASYSGTGSKIMFLRGQIAPSKQWWLVYSCSGTGYFSAYSPELHFAGDVPSCSANSTAAHSGSAGMIQQNALTPLSFQVQADSNTNWNVLIVECTNSQGCKGSPVE